MPKADETNTTKRDTYFHYDIKTAAGLVDALGGEEAVAEEFGVTAQSVRGWEISGHIPNGWHLRLFAMVNALGKTISPTVFGLREDDEEAVALSDLMRAAHRPAEGGAHG